MSVLAEMLGIKVGEERTRKREVVLRTRDGFEKRMAVEDSVVDYGEIKVPHEVSEQTLHAGQRDMSKMVVYTFRRFVRTGDEEDGVQVWEER